MAFHAFAFKQLEEAFGNCVIVAVAASAHAGLQAVYFQKFLPVMARILTSLITVNHHR